MASAISLIGTNSSCTSMQGFLSSSYETLKILFTDMIPTTLTCVIPNAGSWAYRTFWTGSIRSYTLENTAGKVAHLFVHGSMAANQISPMHAVLLLHGDHSHPCTMLHLADVAKLQGKAVFSISLPYDDNHPENHRSLLDQGIEKIRHIAEEQKIPLDLKLIGHSRGALEAASATYEMNYPEISGVIAIAGRFRIMDQTDRPCRESLAPSVHAIWTKLQPSQPLDVPFYQIAAMRDWCIDTEASIVRKDQPYYYVDAQHLSVLYHLDTIDQINNWIAHVKENGNYDHRSDRSTLCC